MRTRMYATALTGMLVLSGCAGMSDTERRTTGGGTLGAAGGALVGLL